MKHALAGLAVASMLLAGCGGSSDDSIDAKASTSTTAASSAPTTTSPPPVPRVSDATICGILFDSQAETLDDATSVVKEFASDPDPTLLDGVALARLSEDLDSLARRAPVELEPHILAQKATMDELVAASRHPQDGQTLNFETFRSSGLEIVNVCMPYL